MVSLFRFSADLRSFAVTARVSQMLRNPVLCRDFPLFVRVLLISREGSYRAVVGLEHDFETKKERVAMKDILYE
jgi:hypothetical protein